MRKTGLYIQNFAFNSNSLPKLFLVGLFLLVSLSLSGQTQITAISVSSSAAPDETTPVTAPSDTDNDIISNISYDVRYGVGNNVVVTSYTVSGIVDPFDNFVFPDTLIIRRTDGSRFINIWYTLDQINTVPDPDQLDVDAEKVADADALYLTRNINAGYDNILVNEDDQAPESTIQAQVERVDIIWNTGVVTCDPDNAVFPVIERGGNDEIKIAAILSLDSNGDPATYSSLIDIEDSDWPGGTTQGQLYDDFLVLRRATVGEDPIPLINFGLNQVTDGPGSAQLVQGVAVSFTEFGILANQVVYGYSIFAFDVNAVDHTLTDPSTFPTDTQASDSGLDLVAGISAAVASDDCLTPATGPGGYKQSLATWLKANEDADVTTSTEASSISDWQDHWLGNHDATSGASSDPLYRSTSSDINFNPTADFTSSATSLSIANNTDFNTSTSYTRKGLNIAFRTNTTDITDRQVLYEQGGTTRGINVYVLSGNLHVSAWNRNSDGSGSPWNNAANITTVSSALALDTEYIVTLELNGNTSVTGTLQAYLNGASFGTLSSVGLLFSDTDGIEFGASDGDTQFADGTNSSANSFEGEISELIYCNEPAGFLSAQRNRIESYLAIKYGITLDQSSPINYVDSDGAVIFNTTNNASIGGYLEYNNDIAGIGRDDGSELDQPKSKSENSGSIVTMDKGASLGTDDTFLIWGNDGAATTTQTSDVPPLINDRLAREWRVAESNETGEVSISFDLTGLGLSTSASDFSLLVASAASDNDFSSASIITGGTLVGNVLTFTGVDLADAEYFTIGTSFISCSPGNVSTNLSVWLKADLGPDNTTDGVDVDTWEDRAGSNDVTAPSASTRPNYSTNVVNYNPALNFDGVDEELRGTAGFYSIGYYAVVVPDASFNRFTSSEGVIGMSIDSPADSPADLGCLCFGSLTNDVTDEVVTHALGSDNIGPINIDEWRASITSTSLTLGSGIPQLVGVKDNSGATSTEVFLNGSNRQSETSGTFITSSNEDYVIGDLNTGAGFSRFFDGKVAEVISYSVRPTDTEHAKIQSYLALKYGITLSADADNDASLNENITGSIDEGDYLASDGTTFPWKYDATYHNDVTGIGRDDDSCLSQKQSKSENAGSIVGIANNTFATTNNLNTNSFSANNSFLVWGNDADDADQANANSSDLPTGVTERMERIWHVEETGTVGSTSVSFDLTGLGYSTDASDFRLITSTSATMASGSTVTGGTFNGNVLTFTGVDFSDEDFFTLGTEVSTCGPGGVSTDLALWLKADAGTSTTTDGADLATWNDQAGSNNTTETSLGGATVVEPTFETSEINFNPIISFTDPGSQNASFMESSSNTVSDDFSLIALFQTGQNDGTLGNFATSPALIGAQTTVGTGLLDYGLGMQNGKVILNASSGNAFDAATTSTYKNNFPHYATATRIQSSGALNIYVDGTSSASGTAGSGVTLSEPASFGIGNHSTEAIASQFGGFIGEVIVFSDDLTSDERNRVESYLSLKYGITMVAADDGTTGSVDERDYRASDSGVIWDFTEQSSGYNSDIAGIGRDDGSCLAQIKSKSENSDAIVTMGIPSLGTDDSFLIWGNDNTTLTASPNAERPATIEHRLNREWYVQETGTVGTVSVTFDLSQVAGPSGVGTNNLNLVRLMSDPTDSDFTSGVTLTSPSSVDAVNKTVTFQVNWADATFFTLGSTELFSLPITLIHFDAQPIGNSKVKVEWTTVEEIGNAYFSIERSTDGLNYETIAQLDGAGNSQDIREYQYIDNKPLNGQAYYRLRQTDFNGTSSATEAVRVYLEKEQTTSIRSLYPNPANAGDDLHVSYSIDNDQVMQFSLISANGHMLHSEERLVVASEEVVTLSTKGLKRGLHILRVVDENQNVVSLKVIIR